MDAWLQETLGWLPSGGPYYLLVGLISFLESLAGVGILVPGSVLIVVAGFLAAHGKGGYHLLVIASALGAIFGDLLSYWLGGRLGEALRQKKLFQSRLHLLQKAELYFAGHGGKSVFIGRFVGFLRPFIPFVAGSTRMPPLPFILYALVSGILWGLAYPGLGYFFGASWKMVRIWTGRFSLFIALIVAFFAIDALFWRWIAPRLADLGVRVWVRCRRSWGSFVSWPRVASFRNRHPRLWNALAERFTLRRGSGLYLTAGFAFSALFAALFLWLVGAVQLYGPLLRLDRKIYALLREAHHPLADTIFSVIAHFGSLPVIAMAGFLLLLWLVLNNRDFSAVIVIAGTSGGKLLVVVLTTVFGYPRPETALSALESFSAGFPSSHAFLSLFFYGLLVYMLLDTVNNWKTRFNLVLGGSFVALLIGFSHIYLGIDWFSSVMGGFALAALWLTFLITASEMRRRYAGEFPWRVGWQPLHLSPAIRRLIMALASAAALGGIAIYLYDRFNGM
jgi:undecaprenyl-diphosphatase